MQNYLRLHIHKLLALLTLSVVYILCFSGMYDLKPLTDKGLLDMFGEGGTALCLAAWIVIFLWVRPQGGVTNTIFTGLALLYISMFQDFLDEIFIIDRYVGVIKAIESIPSTLGMVLLTIGFLRWKREQDYFNNTLTKKEKLLREHTALDAITELYNASYMEKQLQKQIELLQDRDQISSLLCIDLLGFESICQKYGPLLGNRLLKDVARIIEMNIHNKDLLCRYAGERFVVLMPQNQSDEANAIAHEIRQALKHIAYKTDNGEVLDLDILFSCHVITDLDTDCARKMLKHMTKMHGKHKSSISYTLQP